MKIDNNNNNNKQQPPTVALRVAFGTIPTEKKQIEKFVKAVVLWINQK